MTPEDPNLRGTGGTGSRGIGQWLPDRATTRAAVRGLVFYAVLGLILWATLRHAGATVVILAGVGFFHLWKVVLARRLTAGRATLSAAALEAAKPVRIPAWAWATLVVATVAVGAPMVNVSFKAAQDRRMVWAFHEDEGDMADLYDLYLSRHKMRLGDEWRYTCGSAHIMAVSIVARAMNFVVPMDGAACIILNRLMLVGAFLGAGWLSFYMGVRLLRSPGAGVAAALLLWTNSKAVEITLPSNYVDTFSMLLITLAVMLIAQMLLDFTPRSVWLAPLAIGAGFGVKYMGLPLALLAVLAFGVAQKQARRGPASARPSVGRARADWLVYGLYCLLAVPVAFFTVNPYYVSNWKRFVSQLQLMTRLYASGNINALPSSAVRLPTLGDWWHAAVSGGSPDGLLFAIAGLGVLLAGVRLIRMKGLWEPRTALAAVVACFGVPWVAFVVFQVKFAFFHYFLPVLPCAYLMAAAAPLLLADLLPQPLGWLKRRLPELAAAALVLLIAWASLQDLYAAYVGPPSYVVNPLGYAATESTLASRAGLTWQTLAQIRRIEGSSAMQVGQWLNGNCPDARSLVTNETVFYYPPGIKDVLYRNRQMSLRLLFQTMPDLLILSDYFIDMYTRDYSQAEIGAMQPEIRRQFLEAREFYSHFKGHDHAFNYRQIKVFDAPAGWYWKHLRVYKRCGPASLEGLLQRLDGSPLMPAPNGAEILAYCGPLAPQEMYLSALPGAALPYTLDVRLKHPLEITALGLAWWSADDHPSEGSVELWREDRKLLQEPLETLTVPGGEYSWLALDPNGVEADRMVLKISAFAGQQRLILRRLLLETAGQAAPTSDSDSHRR